MTRSEMDALEFWQSDSEGLTERKLTDLVNIVDDLTTLAHSRAGAHMIRANLHQLKAVLRKMHDLYLDFEGVSA